MDLRRSYSVRATLLLLVGTIGARAQSLTLSPGAASGIVTPIRFELHNTAIAASASITAGHLSELHIADLLHHSAITLAPPFALLTDSAALNASTVNLTAPPTRRALSANPNAARLADHSAGIAIDIPWTSADNDLTGVFTIELRNGSNYLRETLTLTAGPQDAPIREVRLLDATLPDAHVVGAVAGSPIVAGDFFLGFEHPHSESHVTAGRATAFLRRTLPLRAGQTVTYSAVLGVARTGQMRRDFLAYLERERAHPYRTFLHYNSWYDLGYFTPYDEAGALDRIHAFGDELTRKRGVKLDSFLFDDGWDNHNSLWSFNSGFPDGFANVRAAATQYNAAPGVWMSPWGGYSKPKQERIAFGREHGYEIVNNGYALSGPLYYARFREVCLDMMRRYGVNQFKFDGTGNADSVVKGSAFDSDFSAALALIGDLRVANPAIYINLTTGTYPSPFWLMTADSIWRGGEDDGFAGVGADRERWITYRDADTYRRIVQGGPLYPLNSLMLHGIIYAQHRKRLDVDPGHDFRNEVRSYFGTGTQLQEMYITPSLLTAANWDDLAEAAKWSRANASVLKDTHWVGGDPAWLEPYGWASWTPHKAILTLRNPRDKPQTIRIDPQLVFELPDNAPHRFLAHSPWKEDTAQPAIPLVAGQPHTFELAPFQVLTLEAVPSSRNE
jgi:hypothetical protein